MKMTMILIVIGALVTVFKNLEKRMGGIGDQGENRNQADPQIVKVSWVNNKSPGDLKGPDVVQTENQL